MTETQGPAYTFNGGDKPADPNADYGELWASVHDYLVCQAAEPPSATDLAKSFTRMVEAHNMIHRRYIAPSESPLEVAGT